MESKVRAKNEYLQQFLESLRESFREDNLWIYEVKEDEGYVKLVYSDSYTYEEIFIDLNEYKVPISVSITKADLDNEIIVPESCHECSEFCEYYNDEDCTFNDSDFDREVNDWEKVLFNNNKITIKRVVVSVKCFLDIPHYHYYKGYEVTLNDSLLPETVISLDNLFDLLVSLVEK